MSRNRPVILIVDDESGIRDTLTGFLNERFDCELREAEDGEEAVKFVQKNKCDVMILDVRMPGKSGLSVVKEVKRFNQNMDILILSAWDSDDVAEETMDLGVTDYAVKPLNLQAIYLKLSNILVKRGQKANKI